MKGTRPLSNEELSLIVREGAWTCYPGKLGWHASDH